ncbi:hypothetical protein [Fodinicola feengrottensis]|uniref:hypothetical protein n=1 Tax=Fodinicola feengrottensis TaxID=435914 RepID=UPI0013D74734|nr:hypothetical protein [Fodinicola feengrottensis]
MAGGVRDGSSGGGVAWGGADGDGCAAAAGWPCGAAGVDEGCCVAPDCCDGVAAVGGGAVPGTGWGCSGVGCEDGS